ncbi:hypothetical protein ABT173_01525 [Streptomyces sp. NPDC001795]|uniref:hypothetical protein n=1 Tax=Streptomyces sp. NPDC001795 TaxID=3154525 RepID=UPI00332839E9
MSNFFSKDGVLRDAAETPISPVDQVRYTRGPDDPTHMDEYYRHLGEQQRQEHRAAGMEKASPFHAESAQLDHAGGAQRTTTAQCQKKMEADLDLLGRARSVLAPYLVRPPRDGIRYTLVILLLLGGDAAGIAGASVSFGESVWLAVALALAVGIAAITTGCAGALVKHAKEARRREKATLTDAEAGFADMFSGADDGWPVRCVLLGCLGTVLLIGIGIGTLRMIADGDAAGLVYGALSVAIATGSWWNSYTHADEVADKLDHLEAVVRRDVRALKKVSRGGPAARQAHAESAAASHRETSEYRGLAAQEYMAAAAARNRAANPQIVGHGRAAGARNDVDLRRTWLEQQFVRPDGNGKVMK